MNDNKVDFALSSDSEVISKKKQSIVCPFHKEIAEMKKELKKLRESEYKRQDWLRSAKKRAGYSNDISFDIVFDELLKIKSDSESVWEMRRRLRKEYGDIFEIKVGSGTIGEEIRLKDGEWTEIEDLPADKAKLVMSLIARTLKKK